MTGTSVNIPVYHTIQVPGPDLSSDNDVPSSRHIWNTTALPAPGFCKLALSGTYTKALLRECE